MKEEVEKKEKSIEADISLENTKDDETCIATAVLTHAFISCNETDQKKDEEPTSRVKVVVNRTDPETGEPIEEDGKLRKSKDKDVDHNKYAFILRKKVYENQYTPFPVQNSSEVDITSLDLWALLKEHLGHYPYHIFRDSPVTLSSPYEHIVFQFDELRVESEKVLRDEKDKQARADLALLLDTISGGASGDEKLDKYFKM